MPRRDHQAAQLAYAGIVNPATSRLIQPIEVFALQLLVIFTTELGVMEICAPMFSGMNVVIAAMLDALLLVGFSSVPLWVLFSPVFVGVKQRDAAVKRTVTGSYLQLCAGFFVFELLIMMILPSATTASGQLLVGIADALLTMLLTAPLLWWLLRRLDRAHCHVLLVDLLETPSLLFLLVLYVIFIADLLQALLASGGMEPPNHGASHLADAMVLTLVIAPFLWIFVARPLRRSVQIASERARAIYEQVIDAVVLTNPYGQIVALNPAAQRIFGVGPDELTGRPAGILFAAASQEVEALLRAAGGRGEGRPGVMREMVGRSSGGGNVTIDVTVSRIVLGGRENFLLIIRDIGERKEAERALRESEARFREIYEQSEDAILFLKPHSTYVIEANTTCEQLFGFDKFALRGEGLGRIFPEECLSRVSGVIDLLQRGDNVQLDHLAARRHDGKQRVVSLRAKIVVILGIELIYCTLRDITERVRMEQEAREIQAKLIQANKMTSLGLLVSGVAHEINNPNEYIMTNAQLFAAAWEDIRKILREYAREHGDFFLGGIAFSEFDNHAGQLLRGMLDGSRRINAIVGTLKQYARQDHPDSLKEVDINRMVSSSIAILRHELARHTDHFRCELADGLPPGIGNGQQLSQVVINLLMNACQALPGRDRGIRIASGFDPATAMVTITVEDEGCGIAAENQRQIMEPFFTTKLDSGGTGLGLSICRSIVAEHRGRLEFSSVPGKGTTFTVNIPASVHLGRDGNP